MQAFGDRRIELAGRDLRWAKWAAVVESRQAGVGDGLVLAWEPGKLVPGGCRDRWAAGGWGEGSGVQDRASHLKLQASRPETWVLPDTEGPRHLEGPGTDAWRWVVALWVVGWLGGAPGGI